MHATTEQWPVSVRRVLYRSDLTISHLFQPHQADHILTLRVQRELYAVLPAFIIMAAVSACNPSRLSQYAPACAQSMYRCQKGCLPYPHDSKCTHFSLTPILKEGDAQLGVKSLTWRLSLKRALMPLRDWAPGTPDHWHGMLEDPRPCADQLAQAAWAFQTVAGQLGPLVAHGAFAAAACCCCLSL